ncbi:MAG: hypothetical protein R3F11_12170 [Verrucomicrobiales bacterium]
MPRRRGAEGRHPARHLGEIELSKRLDLLNRMQSKSISTACRRRKRSARAPAITRRSGTLSRELAKHDASTLEGKLQKPEYGNYVDHEKLFSGEYAGASASPQTGAG